MPSSRRCPAPHLRRASVPVGRGLAPGNTRHIHYIPSGGPISIRIEMGERAAKGLRPFGNPRGIFHACADAQRVRPRSREETPRHSRSRACADQDRRKGRAPHPWAAMPTSRQCRFAPRLVGAGVPDGPQTHRSQTSRRARCPHRAAVLRRTLWAGGSPPAFPGSPQLASRRKRTVEKRRGKCYTLS